MQRELQAHGEWEVTKVSLLAKVARAERLLGESMEGCPSFVRVWWWGGSTGGGQKEA